jgi:hypothetical protein
MIEKLGIQNLTGKLGIQKKAGFTLNPCIFSVFWYRKKFERIAVDIIFSIQQMSSKFRTII